mmetsp:Transcript_10206/g.42926  ORF Transcript_10206/g.42926 Transcript_10206/m.42926 type:complete len:386 (-) Transcript_10206:1857-3014(-)
MPAAAANVCCIRQGILSNDARTSPSRISCAAGARVSLPSKVLTCRKLREFKPAGEFSAADVRHRCNFCNFSCVSLSVGASTPSDPSSVPWNTACRLATRFCSAALGGGAFGARTGALNLYRTIRFTGEPTWNDAFVKSFWPFHDSVDFGSYENEKQFPVVSAASIESALPSTKNSVAATSMCSKSFASCVRSFSCPVSFHRRKKAPLCKSPSKMKFFTTFTVTVCSGVSKNATGVNDSPSHECTMSLFPTATTRFPSRPESAVHAILASRTHARRPIHSGVPPVCDPKPLDRMRHATSNRSARPRQGVSSPPGNAVPATNSDCSAPVRVFRSCTFEIVWTCSPGSSVCCHALSSVPGTNRRIANCSSTPPRAMAFARRVFTSVAK